MVAGFFLVVELNDGTPFDAIKVERYDSRAEAASQWTGVVEAASVPSDASQIVRTAPTEELEHAGRGDEAGIR